MAKKKARARKERRVVASTNGEHQPAPIEQEAPDPRETPDNTALRVSVGRGTLAEHVLDSLELAMGELQRVYGEVAALGKSLALAREQLVEQEAELEIMRETAGA